MKPFYVIAIFTHLKLPAWARRLLMVLGFMTLMGALFGNPISAQTDSGLPLESDPTLRDFDPAPALKVHQTDLKTAKFPVVDIHCHFGFRFKGDPHELEQYLQTMAAHQIAVSISLDSVLGNEEDHLGFLGTAYGQQIASFVHIDFRGKGKKDKPETWDSNQPGFIRDCVEQLRAAKNKGILGLKFHKSFGLEIKNRDGSLLVIDDPRLDPIWETCGQLGFPVIIHTADPVAFFRPIDANNERWEELSRHPDWGFSGDTFPSRDELLSARNRVIEKHSRTTFIGAHCANNSEDLGVVAGWLDQYPNLVIGFASRINELGRQPYTARKFFMKYQDRILFGTDGPWPELRLTYYWRFLESWDEYFPYSEKSPAPQGMWRIYGIGLPDDVLKKIYSENAIRIMPGLKKMVQESAN